MRPYRMQQYYGQPYVAAVAPVVNAPPAQAPQQQNVGHNQNHNARNRTQFDNIQMKYTHIYPHLV